MSALPVLGLAYSPDAIYICMLSRVCTLCLNWCPKGTFRMMHLKHFYRDDWKVRTREQKESEVMEFMCKTSFRSVPLSPCVKW